MIIGISICAYNFLRSTDARGKTTVIISTCLVGRIILGEGRLTCVMGGGGASAKYEQSMSAERISNKLPLKKKERY